MLLKLLPLLICVRGAENPLRLLVNADGSYLLSHATWPSLFLASAPVGVQLDGNWLSSADKSLLLLGPATLDTGEDAWGSFNATTLAWAAASAPSVPLLTTAFRVYLDTPAVAFAAAFPGGLRTGSNGTAQKDGVAAAFPSWALPAAGPLGFFQWAGPFINRGVNGPPVGRFVAPGGGLVTGLSGGPLVLLDGTAAPALVLAPASEFMAVSIALTGGRGAEAVSLGPVGSFNPLPPAWAYEVVAWAGAGVNAAVQAWGAAMMARYGKARGLSRDDFTNTHLIYNTDHGAYYYYQTGAYANYSVALQAVYDYSVSAGIPYRGVLLDSWWYFKGDGGGVKNWSARPDVFTGGNAGIAALVARTGWKVTAHNRYWSANADYAKQNGGAWDFYIDPPGKHGDMSLPLQQEFWAWLLTKSVAEWGLTTYEQDWLYNELMGVDALLTNVTLGRQWLTQLGSGAAAAGVSVQLCMAYPRHALQSLEMPTATQIRASDDHVPGRGGGNTQVQWKMGYSSMLASALGLAPFKDNYWSSAQQPGSSCGNNASEVTPSLHNAASTYSAGPVSPGDGVGLSDVAQILRACNAAGLLLQPSRPATALDSQVARDVFGDGAGRPAGNVHATYTLLSGWAWDHAMAVNLAAPYALTVTDFGAIRSDIPGAVPPPGGVAYSVDADTLEEATLSVAPFDAAHPIALRACGFSDWQLVHAAPVFANGWALLGELGKWVPVAEARFKGVEADAGGVRVSVAGAAGETVRATFWDSGAARSVVVVCVLPASGVAVATVPAGTCE